MKNFIDEIYWYHVGADVIGHFGGAIGLYYLVTGQCKALTCLWAFAMFLVAGIGLGPGAHRYFSHKSYKCTRGFKIFLLIAQTLAGQASVNYWCRVHRVHHKYTDTDKDPTNIKRGFFFATYSWKYKHSPVVEEAMKNVYMDDILADNDIQFTYKYYAVLYTLICITLPSIIPNILWNESLLIGFFINCLRYCLNLYQMYFSNSLSHMLGKKPYDKYISSAENLFCIIFTFGEGYHNYHHVFPFDYNGAEFGDFQHFNIGTIFLDVCAKFGWVYDRKVITPAMIARRKQRTGDGSSWLAYEESHKNPVWGIGDADMSKEDKRDLDEQTDKKQKINLSINFRI